ncbi:A/G-specific adenine glycosylase [Thalassobaculum fulvum]|uniref:Adenine DNA glycosylase n=1 Tax=Thalassobaculum fulvum TaxID=1633335 RepID=A0A918XV10_9PROT|nr:A/G-specific adenine glycosylase [Thalassobaculum fulvum]GHD55737.1 A/G-specific adenine glycosylase [Thalassobaculum fulvum]
MDAAAPHDRASPPVADHLLAWYDRHRRHLPWRAGPGETADPYRVWLSEIMLQQTTVATVGPYFRRFLERWPTVHDLAAAPSEEVMSAWAGLGYYARARNLHACARAVAGERGGVFPDTEAGLRALPGIGAYTAAAIAAIAFDRKATVVDGNVERVVARLFAVEEPMPAAKPTLRALAATLTPDRRPGDFAQAMMDLGATVCTPRRPACLSCPLSGSCDGRIAGIAEELPRKSPKAERPMRRGTAFVVLSGAGNLLLRVRPAKGMLGGMHEVPATPWDSKTGWRADPDDHEPVAGAVWIALPGIVRHGFTHYDLELEVLAARLRDQPAVPGGEWWPLDRLDDAALPTLMAKVVRHALAHLSR